MGFDTELQQHLVELSCNWIAVVNVKLKRELNISVDKAQSLNTKMTAATGFTNRC